MRRSVVLGAASAACMLAGALVFAQVDRLPFWLSAYWAVETGTTVGYGDVTPATGAGRVVATVLMLCAIPLLGATFAALTAEHVHKRNLKLEDRIKQHVAESEDRIKQHVQAHVERVLGRLPDQ